MKDELLECRLPTTTRVTAQQSTGTERKVKNRSIISSAPKTSVGLLFHTSGQGLVANGGKT